VEKSYPDVLATTHRGHGIYGARQIMDITHPVYLYYAERVIRKMMETCAHYDNVIGVQLDNETKAYDTAGPNVQRAFVKYEREKFHDDLEALNRAYGLDYWSNRINAWEDFPDVRGTINGSLGAEFSRFQRKIAADFLMWQRKIVEPYLREDQFITHNTDFNWIGYSYGLNGEVDVYEDAKAMTVVGTDIYHPSQDQLTGMEIAFGGDLTRSVKNDNYLVLETECQGFPQWIPYDGQLRLQAYSHVAEGANMVEYWHWHSIHNSFETYWKGVLSHDFKENETYKACKVIGKEWQSFGDHLVNLQKHNRAAILVSNTALKALDWFSINHGVYGDPDGFYYNDVLMGLYQQMYRMNLECDFIFPQNAEEMIGNYDLVVIPAMYAESQALLNTIEHYVAEGGHILMTFKSAFADENVKVWSDEAPHTLAKVIGASYSHVTIPQNVGLLSDALNVEGEKAERVMELVNPDGCETLVSYVHPSWGRFAAVTRNAYGKGEAMYLGCYGSDTFLASVIRKAAEDAGIELPKEQFPLIVRRGENGEGRKITYLMNYSAKEQKVSCPADGIELTGGMNVVQKGHELTLQPWNLLIIEE
jgi:beta-galactosidase